MGVLNYLTNKMTTSSAMRPMHNGKQRQVVTLTSNYNTMPMDGEKLISNGFQLQTMSCDKYGHYTWVFVRAETAPQAIVSTPSVSTSTSAEYVPTDGLFSPQDPIVRKAVAVSIQKGKYSTAMLQTFLGKRRDYIDELTFWLEDVGIIGPQDGKKPRDLLIRSMADFDKKAEQYLNNSKTSTAH